MSHRDAVEKALDVIDDYFVEHPHPDDTDGHECLVVVRSVLDGTARDEES